VKGRQCGIKAKDTRRAGEKGTKESRKPGAKMKKRAVDDLKNKRILLRN